MRKNTNAHIICFSATFPQNSLENVGLDNWPGLFKEVVKEEELTLKNIK